MFKYIAYTISVLFSLSVTAQEGLKPLSANINYLYGDIRHSVRKQNNQISSSDRQNKNNTSAKSVTSLSLPFFDDFSYSPYQSYPSQLLWSDSSTYVNSGYAIAPLSIGVATFDGLNKYGYPYLPNNQTDGATPSPADTLTSKPIDLTFNTPIDSLALIFYYQARGNGEAPEIGDSLLVDFYKPKDNTWTNVWFERGNTGPNVNDTMFKRAFIRLEDTAYLHDGFKFRFRNKATTSGNFDHWNLDYVYLDIGRHILSDTSYNDIAFGYIPSPLLRNYAVMPWRQYDTSEMARHYSVFLRNNGTAPNITYKNILYDATNSFTQLGSYSGGNTPSFGYFKYSGWLNLPAISNPPNTYTILPMSNFKDYEIKHYLVNNADFAVGNDTVIQHQDFNNFYAYDDGSCEAGYYIYAQGGKMAQKYVVKIPDTLRAVRIYFDPAGSLSLAQTYGFNITIWQPGASGPSNLIFHRDSTKYVNYFPTAGVNWVSEYQLTNPVVLPSGTYYIGFQQRVATGIVVGFDKNLDHSQNLYYDSGAGWTQSQIYGSLMLRPVFGSDPPTTGIKENLPVKNNLFSLYPNPAANQFIIQSANTEKGSYTLIDAIGQTIDEGLIENQKQIINTENISNGVYFLILKVKGQPVEQHKIIIQH